MRAGVVIIASTKGNTIQILKLILETFSQVSGPQINYGKSNMVPFNLMAPEVVTLEASLQCQVSSLPIIYLGLPLTITRPNRTCYMPLLEKLEKRLAGWKCTNLSKGGKHVLVNSVLSSIPVYFMACFKLPGWVLKRIDQIRRSFLWMNTNRDKKGVPLVNWDVLCLPKNVGGMGIKNLKLHNLALLMRWIWKLYGDQTGLWSLFAITIYGRGWYANGPLILRKKGSFFWVSLQSLDPIRRISIKWEIGDGSAILFWDDNWGGGTLSKTMGPDTKLPSPFVSLRDAWPQLHNLLPSPMTAMQHHIIKDGQSNMEMRATRDRPVWVWTSNGEFSVASLYKALSVSGKTGSSLADVWKCKVSPSLRIFFYLLLQDRLLTQDVMLRRNFVVTQGCKMCNHCPSETAVHLFFLCPTALQIWASISSRVGIQMLQIAPHISTIYEASKDIIKRNTDSIKRW